MEAHIEKDLVDLYVSNIEAIERGLTPAVNRRRSEAIESFNLCGFPDLKSEKYKYFDVKSRFEGSFVRHFTSRGESGGNCDRLPVDCHKINLLNGFSDGMCIEDNGLVYGSFRAAANRYPAIFERYYDTLSDNASDGVSALNTAFAQDGAFVYVSRNFVPDKPVMIVNCLCGNEDMYVYARNLMIFEEGAQAKIIFDSDTCGEGMFLVNSLTEIFAEQNSDVEVVDLQRGNAKTIHLQNSYSKLSAGSSLKISTITLGGSAVRNNNSAKLAGAGAELHNYGLYLCSGSEFIDNYTYTEHSAADCSSKERYKGVAAGEATAVFSGRILVAKDAQRTNASMENHNILLSDSANIHTRPQLEIYADDVKCNHGATIGQLDPNAIFYMRQRGIDEVQAKKLQMYGFVNEIVDKIGISSVVEFINDLAIKKIENI